MPTPTALQRAPAPLAQSEPQDVALISDSHDTAQDLEIITEEPKTAETSSLSAPTHHSEDVEMDLSGRPHFAPSTVTSSSPTHNPSDTAIRIQSRKVPIPPHRMSPLKSSWPKIYPPLVEHLKLQVRMNIKSKAVEMRTSRFTSDAGALQKGEDFIRAFTLGFDVDDAIALLRLDDLYIETFEIKDVKTLQGEHLGRAIGRIAGKDGKTKFAIENTSKTRVVLADSKIHILGGFSNIRVAREAVVSLILGKPPGKVYGNLRTVAGRMKERF
jgi:RNA-binding protein PNO1